MKKPMYTSRTVENKQHVFAFFCFEHLHYRSPGTMQVILYIPNYENKESQSPSICWAFPEVKKKREINARAPSPIPPYTFPYDGK